MKTRLILTLAMLVLAFAAFAQKIEMTKNLTRDEVPVVVVIALQKDFPSLTDNGTWKLFYLKDLKTLKLTPKLYEYACKKDGERVEVAYRPDGTFDHAKGIDPPPVPATQQ